MRPKTQILADTRTDISPKLARWVAWYKREYSNQDQATLYELEKDFIERYCEEFNENRRSEGHIILEKVLGCMSSSLYHCRRVVGSTGEKHDVMMTPVWELIDSGTWKLSTGCEVVKVASRFTKLSGVPYNEALPHVIDKALNTDSVWALRKILEDEAIDYRKQNADDNPPKKRRRSTKRRSKDAPPKQPVNDSGRKQFLQWLDKQLETVPEADRIYLREQYRMEFKLLTDRLYHQMNRFRESCANTDRRMIQRALETLNLEIPSPGTSFNLLTIKAAYKRQAFEFHPDRGGDEESYIAITDAYNTIERAYNQYRGTMP